MSWMFSGAFDDVRDDCVLVVVVKEASVGKTSMPVSARAPTKVFYKSFKGSTYR